MRVAWLDYARAFAAFSVLSVHYLAGRNTDFGLGQDIAQYGYLGVPLFFMISGFVISSSVEGKTAGEFVVGRLVRLYPTFVLCLTISAVILLPAMRTEFWYGTEQYLANLTLCPSLFGMPFMDIVYWTLVLEIQFYAAVAVLILLRVALRPGIWHPLWVAGIVLAALLHADGQFPLFGGYFGYFAAGAVIYDIRRHGFSLMRVGMLGILAAVTISYSVQESAQLAVERAQSLNGGVVLIIIAMFYFGFLTLEAADARGWRPPQAKLLGLMTYPLYLLHARLGYFAFFLISAGGAWQTYIATTALMTGLALVITSVIEPAIRPAWKRAIGWVVGRVLPLQVSAAAPQGEMVPPSRFERETPRSTI